MAGKTGCTKEMDPERVDPGPIFLQALAQILCALDFYEIGSFSFIPESLTKLCPNPLKTLIAKLRLSRQFILQARMRCT